MAEIKVWVDKSQSRTRKRKRDEIIQPARPTTYRQGQLDRVLTTGARTRSEKRLISLPAAHRALGTVELVENMILQMPMLQIWGLQRVCKQWRDIIATSMAIGQKMFLEQSDLTAALGEPVDCGREGIAFLQNPPPSEPMHLAVCTILLLQRIYARTNPLWAAIYSRYTTFQMTRIRDISLVPAVARICTWLYTEIMHDWSLGSWQSMYLTDPPCPAVIAICWWKFDLKHGFARRSSSAILRALLLRKFCGCCFMIVVKMCSSRSGGYWSPHVVESWKGRVERKAEKQYGRLQGWTKFSGKLAVCLTFPENDVLEWLGRDS